MDFVPSTLLVTVLKATDRDTDYFSVRSNSW